MSEFHVALDTSQGFSLAIADKNGKILLKENFEAVGRESDRLLLPWVMRQLEAVGTTLKEVGRWTVGIGPGSFAGLRCGIAMVKGVALVSGAAMRGVPSAYALAAQAPDEARSVGVLHDGRCGELLFERFVREADGLLVMQDEPEPILPASLLQQSCKCDCYLTAQEAVIGMLPDGVSATLVNGVPASALVAAPEALYPWPADWDGCEKSTAPLYVRQAVFVKPAVLRKS